MSKDTKRIILLVSACLVWIWSANFIMDRLGFFPKVKPKPAVVEHVQDPAADPAKDGPAGAAPKGAPVLAAPAAPEVPIVPPDDLVLGSLADKAGYLLRVQLAQPGAGVDMIELARHEAERDRNKKDRKPLRLVQPDPAAPASFALNIISLRDAAPGAEDSGAKFKLDTRRWEVVRDEKGRTVRPVLDPKTQAEIGQEVVFRSSVGDPAVTITKTFRLRKGSDGLELSLGFESPKARKLIYRLNGPHGLPVEGEWYTSMFREVFFGLAKGATTQVETRLATDVVKKQEQDAPEIFQTLPIKYAGVENQYFAVFFAPDPPPTTDKSRVDAETMATVVRVDPKDKQKSDISVALTSKDVEVGPNHRVSQSFKIFAGPKTADALRPFGAEDLAAYRKSGWFSIPYASTLAQGVIAPLLDRIYSFTTSVAHLFGGQRGNYGIAIILLTITVRLLLFPLSRKQAISAKRMQDLQPLMAELKEKYKDDKEAMTRETFALYKTYKVNPLGGCLLGLIQLPIFVGLWQALNNSVALRHARFLWIDNLAAPDMLFQFPTELPILGNYFNLLPFAVVGLMLVQMKLFSPPATTPDQEMTQKMMKIMMIFMSFMFYKVPSGLGIYFITSSTWAICERLLLPKMIKNKPIAPQEELGDGKGGRNRPGPNGNGNGGGGGNPPKPGGFRDRLNKLLAEASNDRTIRNNSDKDRDRDADRGGKPRPKPGKRR
ncbi:MAG: rane protein insertase, YidC/Oxa1 family, C-terminal domain protein [Planctomycetota bacterium]|nr:rane protein insertase, YidC/Oxa1 family, C-terminal domain protein [Planctomycetota bacterium]